MIKFGIHTPEDFHSSGSSSLAGQIKSFFTRNRYSYLLMRVPIPASAQSIRIFETITQQMLLSGNIYRTTFRGRFANLNPLIDNLLASRFAAQTPFMVADWASSDCLTSAEWAQSLLNRFPNATYRASDLTLSLLAIHLAGNDTFITEINGEPLQYITGPLVVRLNPAEPAILWINRYLAMRARTRLKALWPTLELPEPWLVSPAVSGEASIKLAGGIRVDKISVVHPEASALAQAHPRFSVARHSAFDSLQTPVDVIRTMNIFNVTYFSRDRLMQGAHAVWQSLRPSGVWIVGRTVRENPSVHEVTVFERTPTGFSPILRVGPGSEIENWVLEQQWQ